MNESNGYANILESIIQSAYAQNPMTDDDYLGKDGLMYCGKCNTAREAYIRATGMDQEIKVPITCKCRSEKELEEQERLKKQKRIDYANTLKRRSNMDKRYESVSFEGIVETAANKRPLKICKRYVDKFDDLYVKNQGLLFYGVAGTGKTHFACAIANELMNRGTSVYVTSLVKIIEKISSFSRGADETALFDTLNRPKLLVLDDLGAERGTDFGLEIVYNVIDSRYRTGKPMIVTTNFSLEEMQSATDQRLIRVFDRIFEVCYPVMFTGNSVRMKKAATKINEMKNLLEG